LAVATIPIENPDQREWRLLPLKVLNGAERAG
jgi:hypothetical protein